MHQLPLFGRVLFVDWHGVVSRDPFWLSILENQRHPLNRRLGRAVRDLFSDNDFVTQWMLGHVSSTTVSEHVARATCSKLESSFLARKLVRDCIGMKVNTDLMRLLRSLRPMVQVVLATDNMDCFVTALRGSKPPRRRVTSFDRLRHWVPVYDAFLCSSDIGMLKATNPEGFFGDYLEKHSLTFAQALLIDDRADNCAAFVSRGGTAVQWKLESGDLGQLSAAIHRWLSPSVTEAPIARVHSGIASSVDRVSNPVQAELTLVQH
jgi:hypothetical protein